MNLFKIKKKDDEKNKVIEPFFQESSLLVKVLIIGGGIIIFVLLIWLIFFRKKNKNKINRVTTFKKKANTNDIVKQTSKSSYNEVVENYPTDRIESINRSSAFVNPMNPF